MPPVRASGEPIPDTFVLWQQGVDFLAAAELIFHSGRREIIDASVMNAVFAVRLLLRAALGDGAPHDPDLSVADLFGRLDADAQAGILRRAKRERGYSVRAQVESKIRTWLEWHEFLEAPKGWASRAEFYINLGRATELYLLKRDPKWGLRSPYRADGPLARSRPLGDEYY